MYQKCREGGYVTDYSDDKYEKEVALKEENEQIAERRPVAAVIGVQCSEEGDSDTESESLPDLLSPAITDTEDEMIVIE